VWNTGLWVHDRWPLQINSEDFLPRLNIDSHSSFGIEGDDYMPLAAAAF
jgi:hypothetical protein